MAVTTACPNRSALTTRAAAALQGATAVDETNAATNPLYPPPPRGHAPLMAPALVDVRPRPRVPGKCRYAASVAHVGSTDKKRAGGPEEKSRCGSHKLVREAAGTEQ